MKTLEAIVEADGRLRISGDEQIIGPRRVLVTVLDDAVPAHQLAVLSEEVLSDWNREEEDEAWSHLQPAP